jgi:hypothetical protein
MARSPKKNSYLVTALVLFAALVLALMNPGMPEFKEYYQDAAAASARQSASGGMGELFGVIAKGVAGIKSSDYARANFGLFSLYRSRYSDGAVIHSYLGIAKSFIKMK